MNGFSKILRVLGIVLVVAVAGVAIGLLVTKGKSDGSARPSADLTAGANPKPGVRLPQRPAPTAVSPQPGPGTAGAGSAALTSPTISPATAGLITNWEDRLDDILGADSQESEKARQLLAIFPRLPEDGQVEVAQHLSNLVDDADYAAFGRYLTNAAMPETVLDVLLSDALNRPNSLKLPLLLDVAQNPDHPKASEAKDLLELYLEEDYGNDWAKWRAKAEEWLKDNPD